MSVIINKITSLFNKNKLFIPLGIISAGVVLVGAGIAVGVFNPAQQASAIQSQATSTVPEYYTATVTRGDIELSATGSGTLVSQQVAELGFSTSGTVKMLGVKPGDIVSIGDVLAEIITSKQLEADVAQCQLDVLEAEQTLNALQNNAEVNLASSFEAWVKAKAEYEDALYASQKTSYSRCSQETTTRLALELERATEKLEKYSDKTSEDWEQVKNNYDTSYANYTYCAAYSEDEKTVANAALAIAEAALKQTEITYTKLKDSSGIDQEELALAEANLLNSRNQLDIALENLSGTILTSPIEGTVISINAGVGEMVDTSVFMTIANLNDLAIEVSVDESDLSFLTPGASATIGFDSLSNALFTGIVSQVDPTLNTSDQYSLATGTIQLEIENNPYANHLMLGLNASVSLVAEQASNTLLVPVEALRDLGEGQYAVFVVSTTGQLTFRGVEVGIISDTHAQIISGLDEGETVSTGLVSTRS